MVKAQWQPYLPHNNITRVFILPTEYQHAFRTNLKTAANCTYFDAWYQSLYNTDVQFPVRKERLLDPWSRVLPEKLTRTQLVKKFSAFYGTQRFITTFTTARHLSLSSARSIQSMTYRPTSRISILILSFHLCLGLRRGLLPSGFATITLYARLPSPILDTSPAFTNTRASKVKSQAIKR